MRKMIRKLKTEKICYNIITYNELVLDVKWLERNNFNKISTKDESYSESTIKEIIVTTNSGDEILLKSDEDCEIFFNQYK